MSKAINSLNQKTSFFLRFTEPVSGYWDGGKKIGGEFFIDTVYGKRNKLECISKTRHPGPGHKIKWGSWCLNFFFTVKSGRNWAEAKHIAMRKVDKMTAPPHTLEA